MTVYSSISEAGRSIGVTATGIKNAFRRQKEQDASPILIKKRYQITKLVKRLERIHAIRSHRVSVLDSLTNETSVYPSIREAAKGIGVSKSSISQAFIRLFEGDSVRVKKKRYQITKLQD